MAQIWILLFFEKKSFWQKLCCKNWSFFAAGKNLTIMFYRFLSKTLRAEFFHILLSLKSSIRWKHTLDGSTYYRSKIGCFASLILFLAQSKHPNLNPVQGLPPSSTLMEPHECNSWSEIYFKSLKVGSKRYIELHILKPYHYNLSSHYKLSH